MSSNTIPATTSYAQQALNAGTRLLGYAPIETHSFMKGTITLYDNTQKSVVSIQEENELGGKVEYIMLGMNKLLFKPVIEFENQKISEITILDGNIPNFFQIHFKKTDGTIQKWHVDTDKVIDLPWGRNAYKAIRDKKD
jgi:hypothetical protein